MKKYTIVNNFKHRYYDEISQRSSIKFSVAKRLDRNTFSIEYTPFKCKDFLNEVLIARILKVIPVELYGFKVKDVDTSTNIYLYITSDKKEECSSLLNNFHMLTELEEEYKLSKQSQTKLYHISDYDIVVKVPKYWRENQIMLSLYTLILRCLAYDTEATDLKTLLDINSLSKNASTYGEDFLMLKEIFCNEYFNIDVFLNNTSKIFSKNKITGIDDRSTKKGYCNYEWGIKGNSMTMDLSVRTLHNNGIIYLVRQLVLAIKNGIPPLEQDFNAMGRHWKEVYLELHHSKAK